MSPPEKALESSIRLALLVYAFAVLGCFLLVAPWTPVWEQASVSFLPTALGGWVMSGWVRGAVSGLGVLDLVVAGQVGLESRRGAK